jgi:hypothetical protein
MSEPSPPPLPRDCVDYLIFVSVMLVGIIFIIIGSTLRVVHHICPSPDFILLYDGCYDGGNKDSSPYGCWNHTTMVDVIKTYQADSTTPFVGMVLVLCGSFVFLLKLVGCYPKTREDNV